MNNEITINTTIEITETTTKQIPITQAKTTMLAMLRDNKTAYLAFDYLDADGAVVKTRYFKVSGAPYTTECAKYNEVRPYDTETWARADTFAMALIGAPEMIDGVEVVELKVEEFLEAYCGDFMR